MPDHSRRPIINAHCHLLNFKFVPDRMIRRLAMIPEDWADDRWLGVAAGVLFAMLPGRNYNRIEGYLETLRRDIDDVTERYVHNAMRDAEFDICVPLMMDLEPTVPDAADVTVPYDEQIDIIAAQAARFPWRIFPFVMFDPRRDNAAELCRKALREKGFIGIKMYPALGYHPIPDHPLNHANPAVAANLRAVYAMCADRAVPITAHASVGGAYTTARDKNREQDAWPLTEVSNWIEPIREFDLKVSFAHLGGNYLHDNGSKRVQSATWRRQILNLIRQSRRDPHFGEIYADLSYHDMALGNHRMRRRYFADLRELMTDDELSTGLLFGTDASMISHTWSETEFTRPFRDQRHLPKPYQDRLFSINPTRFLFGDGSIPQTYVNAITGAGQQPPPPPAWVKATDHGYAIVS